MTRHPLRPTCSQREDFHHDPPSGVYLRPKNSSPPFGPVRGHTWVTVRLRTPLLLSVPPELLPSGLFLPFPSRLPFSTLFLLFLLLPLLPPPTARSNPLGSRAFPPRPVPACGGPRPRVRPKVHGRKTDDGTRADSRGDSLRIRKKEAPTFPGRGVVRCVPTDKRKGRLGLVTCRGAIK